MTTPPDIQKQIEEVAHKVPMGLLSSDSSNYDTIYERTVSALTEITQPLLERIAALDEPSCDCGDVYYSEEHDNYYCGKCHGGMGNEYYKLRHQLTTLQAKVKRMKEAGDVLDRRLEVWRGCECGKCISCEAITNWRNVTKEL